MTTIVLVLCVDPTDESSEPHRGDLVEINVPSGAQKVPGSDSEGAADGEPGFIPNPDLALP